MTRLQLSGGVVIEIEVGLDEIRKALEQAIERDTLLELRSPNGRVRLVNPVRIEVVEAVEARDPDQEVVRAPVAEPA